eukprot:3094782-Rhodomonas_salina.3
MKEENLLPRELQNHPRFRAICVRLSSALIALLHRKHFADMTAREQSLNAESEEDTNDRVCVYPRRKAGEEKMGSDRPPVVRS